MHLTVPGPGPAGPPLPVPLDAAVAARPAPPPDLPGADPVAARLATARAVLDRRAAALLARDRAGFLADVDPRASDFRDAQASLFDALVDVPLDSWAYDVQGPAAADTAALEARHGGPVQPVQAVLRYGFAGVPAAPTVATQLLTFVLRDGRWLLAADDDLDSGAVRTARGLWDSGPVDVVRGDRSLVLGHPGRRALLERLAADADAAVPRASAVWGDAWPQTVVVLVPADEAEMRRLLGQDLPLGDIAAVATAQLAGGPGVYDPVGDRVVVHPVNYPALGPVGRRVVLTHEVAHVASRRVSGPALPLWLVEGLADHVAYAGSGVPRSRTAPHVLADAADGRLPDGFPTDEDFRASGTALTAAYEQAWLAVTHLVDVHGLDAVLRLYRQVGEAPPGADPDAVLAAATAEVLGTTPEAAQERWRASLAGASQRTAGAAG